MFGFGRKHPQMGGNTGVTGGLGYQHPYQPEPEEQPMVIPGPSPEMFNGGMPQEQPENPFVQQLSQAAMQPQQNNGPFGLPAAPGMPPMTRFKPQMPPGMGAMNNGMQGLLSNMPGMHGKVGLPGMPGINAARFKPSMPPGLGFLGGLFGKKKKPVQAPMAAPPSSIGPSPAVYQPPDQQY